MKEMCFLLCKYTNRRSLLLTNTFHKKRGRLQTPVHLLLEEKSGRFFFRVSRLQQGRWGSNRSQYVVLHNFVGGVASVCWCTCAHGVQFGHPCRHFWVVFMQGSVRIASHADLFACACGRMPASHYLLAGLPVPVHVPTGLHCRVALQRGEGRAAKPGTQVAV